MSKSKILILAVSLISVIVPMLIAGCGKKDDDQKAIQGTTLGDGAGIAKGHQKFMKENM